MIALKITVLKLLKQKSSLLVTSGKEERVLGFWIILPCRWFCHSRRLSSAVRVKPEFHPSQGYPFGHWSEHQHSCCSLPDYSSGCAVVGSGHSCLSVCATSGHPAETLVTQEVFFAEMTTMWFVCPNGNIFFLFSHLQILSFKFPQPWLSLFYYQRVKADDLRVWLANGLSPHCLPKINRLVKSVPKFLLLNFRWSSFDRFYS